MYRYFVYRIKTMKVEKFYFVSFVEEKWTHHKIIIHHFNVVSCEKSLTLTSYLIRNNLVVKNLLIIFFCGKEDYLIIIIILYFVHCSLCVIFFPCKNTVMTNNLYTRFELRWLEYKNAPNGGWGKFCFRWHFFMKWWWEMWH